MEIPNGYNPETEPQLDAAWFAEFKEASSRVGLSTTDRTKRDTLENQRQLFLDGEIEKPDIENREFNLGLIDFREKQLLELKERILDEEENKVIKQTYRWKINEAIAGLRLTRATALGDEKRYRRYSEFIYGRPDQEIFDRDLGKLWDLIKENLDSSDELASQFASELTKLINFENRGDQMAAEYDEATFKALQNKAESDYADYGLTLESEGYVTAENLADMFQQAISESGIDGYSVRIANKPRTALKVLHGKKMVSIPHEFELTTKRAKQLINHELLHLKRKTNGARSSLALLEVGLDRYNKGEEGLATLGEQGFDEEFEDFGRLDYSLAVCLAYGCDGEPKSFRQLYEIMQRFYYLTFKKERATSKAAQRKAQKKAWTRCTRVLKGAPGKACDLRQMIYRQGSIATFYQISGSDEEMHKFTIGAYEKGKYDQTNNRHLWILTQLGISESDLDEANFKT